MYLGLLRSIPVSHSHSTKVRLMYLLCITVPWATIAISVWLIVVTFVMTVWLIKILVKAGTALSRVLAERKAAKLAAVPVEPTP